MSGQPEIRLNNVKISDQQDIDILIQAANDIQNATEANFRHMQDKKWYNRLWEMITFSKDNQKVMVKNVASLAKMQDIIVKALLIASKDERKIAEYMADNAQQLRDIARLQPKLTKAIEKIIYEHEPRPDIKDMSEEHQYVIVSAVWKFVDIICSDDDVPRLAQEYLRNLKTCCMPLLRPEAKNFDCKKINELNFDGHKLLAIILCETAILLNDSPQKKAAFEEIKGYIAIAPRALNDINKKVMENAKLLGKESIASYYAEIVTDENAFLLNDEEIEFEETDQLNDEECEFEKTDKPGDVRLEPKKYDFTQPPDAIENQFPRLRETILKYVPAVRRFSKNRDPEKDKSIAAFIKANSLSVVRDTVIALIDTTLTGDGEHGFLFTTHAIYYKTSHKKVVKIAYSDIVYEKCNLGYNKKGKPSSLNIVIKGADTITVKYDINFDLFLNMLIEIGKLSEFAPADSPQPIAELDYAVKLPFVKIMVNFMDYSKQPYIELMRFACDIGFTDEQLSELAKYISGSKESDLSILSQLNNKAPHTSRKSLRYALLTEIYNQLQVVKDSLDVAAREYEFIQKIAKLYGFSSEEIANLKLVAETKSKIINGQIKSVEELGSVGNALASLTLAGGVTMGTVVGSSFLFWNSRWVWFIPGIGTVIGAIFTTLTLVFMIFGNNKDDAEFNKQIQEMIAKEKESYKSAINRLSLLFHSTGKEIMLLEKHLERLPQEA